MQFPPTVSLLLQLSTGYRRIPPFSSFKMELCTATTISPSNPTPHHQLLSHSAATRLKPSLHLKPGFLSLYRQGACSYSKTLLRATTSEEMTSEVGKYAGDMIDEVVADRPVDNDADDKIVQVETFKEESLLNDQEQPFTNFLDKLNIQLNSGDSFSLLLYGGGAFLSVWLLSAIVGAIDAIPVFPKLMEVVGLGYTVWFSTRYLLFKRSRDELAAKFEDIKQQVLGSSDLL
ncbi:hypothetical protein Dimus_017761 [Dionaea muscipula]